MLETTQRRIRVGDVTVAYQTAGRGPPLVLLHGLAGSTRWWRHNVAALAAHFQLYLVDLIGFGASCGRQRFDLARAADQLAGWMRLAGIARASLVGHSMGGSTRGYLCADSADLGRPRHAVAAQGGGGPARPDPGRPARADPRGRPQPNVGAPSCL